MSIQALIQVMEELNEHHLHLLEFAEQKKQVLIQNEVEKLNQIVNKENQWIKKVTQCDQRRVMIIGEFLISKGYRPNAAITISDLIKLIFNAGEKQQIIDLQKKILQTIDQLKERNRLNQTLIEQSLMFIDYSLDLIIGPPEDEVVYHNPHQHNNGTKRSGTFDSRA
jgi:flagellar biosynthesis/type III secretory pathway chaperone